MRLVSDKEEKELAEHLVNMGIDLRSEEASVSRQNLMWTNAVIEAKEALVRAAAKRYIIDKILDNAPEARGLSDKVREYVKSKESSKERKYYLWVTINPKSDVTIVQLEEAISSVLSKIWITKATYCFEQRGKTESDVGQGLHCHMLLLRGSKALSEAKREIYNSVKDLVGDPKAVHVITVPRSWGADKISYMDGTKWDSGKEDSVKMNKVWRADNGLQDIYNYEK